MIEIIRNLDTSSKKEDFQNLVIKLDAELKIRDGIEHAFYNQFNKIESLKFVIMAYDYTMPIACAAIKPYTNDAMEVKRMFVLEGRRNEGIATLLLKHLEAWALELDYSKCVLETGKMQPEAIALYKKNGYTVIPNYGQYENVENSVCFEKKLIKID